MFSEIYFLNVLSIGAKDKQAMSMEETQHVQDLNKIMLSWDQAGFVKQDTIHSKQAIRFSKEVLNIDEKVEKKLLSGVWKLKQLGRFPTILKSITCPREKIWAYSETSLRIGNLRGR